MYILLNRRKVRCNNCSRRILPENKIDLPEKYYDATGYRSGCRDCLLVCASESCSNVIYDKNRSTRVMLWKLTTQNTRMCSKCYKKCKECLRTCPKEEVNKFKAENGSLKIDTTCCNQCKIEFERKISSWVETDTTVVPEVIMPVEAEDTMTEEMRRQFSMSLREFMSSDELASTTPNEYDF